MKKTLIITAALLAGIATQANAQIVTKKFQVVASGFEGGAPIGTVKGIFEFTYNSAAFLTPPALVNVTGFNVPYAGAALFSFNKMNDMLTVGNNIGFNTYTVSPATPGFGFFLKNLSTNPGIGSLSYSANGQIWHASEFTVTVPSGVPEASSWVMMIGGFGAAGGLLRATRRRRTGDQAFA
jgi:hypothetical protein